MIDIMMTGRRVMLGMVGENLHRRAVFDISRWQELYPDGVITLLNRRYMDKDSYPVASVEIEGNRLFWTLTNADTGVSGIGVCELIVTTNGIIADDRMYEYYIAPSLCSGKIPDPWDIWQARFREDLLKTEGYVRGTQNGIPVGPEHPRYHDNALFYYEQTKTIINDLGLSVVDGMLCVTYEKEEEEHEPDYGTHYA